MMNGARSRGAAFLLLLAVLLAGAGRARAEDPDIRHIPPNVMILIDTSGSMEYEYASHVIPECKNNPAVDDPARRTRWMQTLDLLLGPITDESYACTRLYPGTTMTFYEPGIDQTITTAVPADNILPHFVATGERVIPLGVLEKYREFVRFGFASLDSFESSLLDGSGMWSYSDGGNHAGRDVGIKKKEPLVSGVEQDVVPGALVSWGGDSANVNFVNSTIRRELTQVIPYCGSPIAAALDDLEYFFINDPDNKAKTNGGNDGYYECRDRFTILITDGKPNTGEGKWGYDTSAEEAADLWNLTGVRAPLFVIGFSTCPAGTTEGDSTRAVLNEIANAGCPPTNSLCPDDGAFWADDTDGLMNIISTLLHDTMSDASSRTLATTTNLVGPHATSGVVQYQFNTSFKSNPGAPWQGILERTSYVCVDDTVQLGTAANGYGSEYMEYGGQLNARLSGRTIYTMVDPLSRTSGSALQRFETTNTDLTPAALGKPGGTSVWAKSIIDFIHGRTATRRDPAAGGKRLGDPFHASTAILGPPVNDLPYVSYYLYQDTYMGRIPVIFLATNEGMIHAFRVQDTGTASQKGEELWAYVPGLMLPNLKDQVPDGHIWGVDSTPITGDIRVFKDADAATEEKWMGILVGGFRQGANGYYALDVTKPTEPKFLWEISDRKTGFGGLKMTYASPFLGTVFTTHPGLTGEPLGEVAVVAFPGGFNPATRSDSTSLYVVTADKGVLLKELVPEFPAEYGCGATPNCDLKPQCCAQFITSPVGYPAMPGFVTTRIFLGDDRGRLWRANLNSKDRGKWKLELFYPHPAISGSPYTTGQPVENAISLAMNENGQLVVIFGTGPTSDLSNMGQNYMFSLTETLAYDSVKKIYVSTASKNWSYTFPAGEKLTGQPVIFNNVVYFATFLPVSDTANPCTYGKGRIYGLYYNTKDPNRDGDESDFAQLDADGTPGGEMKMYEEYANTVVAGLTLIQRPSCLDIDPMSGLTLQRGAPETYELVAQASGAGGVKEGARSTATITKKLVAPTFKSTADSWGALIE